MHSLRFRLLLSLTLVAVIAVGAVAVFARKGTSSQFQRYVQDKRSLRGPGLERTLGRYYSTNGSWTGVQPLVEQVAQISGERIILADRQGIVVADSDRDLLGQKVAERWPPPSVILAYNHAPVGSIYVNPMGRDVPVDPDIVGADPLDVPGIGATVFRCHFGLTTAAAIIGWTDSIGGHLVIEGQHGRIRLQSQGLDHGPIAAEDDRVGEVQ